MVDDEIADIISGLINDGYLLRCGSKTEAVEILQMLKRKGYNFADYSNGLYFGYIEYDDAYPNVGLVGTWINWWADAQSTHRVLDYSDIVNDVVICDDTDDDFEDKLTALLS